MPRRYRDLRNLLDADVVRDLREQRRRVAPHRRRVTRHYVEIGADVRGEIGLVDDQVYRVGGRTSPM